MLVSRCYLKNIREYEERTNTNILRLFDKISIANMIQLMKIFLGEISDDDCCILLDQYISEDNKSIIDIYNEFRDCLLGYKYLDKNNKPNNEEETDSSEDITKYKLLSDYYMKLCMQLMSLGVTYNEFWSFTTHEMYQVYAAIQQKMINDYNREMQIAHTQAAMIGGAVWGKLAKEPPQIGKQQELDFDDDELIMTELGEMTRGDYNLYLALEKGVQ